jgi:hypothetical protein
MRYAVPDDVAENVIAVGREGRGLQRAWRAEGEDGRELVCVLAAFGPDIERVEDCPSDYMPVWLSFLIPTLSENIPPGELSGFLVALGERARLWSRLDEAAWARVRTGFLIDCVAHALDQAERVRPPDRPDWSRRAEAAAAEALDLLGGRGRATAAEVETTARKAAEDARAAFAAARDASDTDLAGRALTIADTGWTAQSAVSPANVAEGWEASRAAQMCARGWSSGEAAKAGLWAPPSAQRFAWEAELLSRLASTLFAGLETEIAAAGSEESVTASDEHC